MSAVAFDHLTERQREGMEREFWDSLSRPQQEAFIDPDCIRGDGRPRLTVAGAMLCVEHLEQLQGEFAMTGPEPTPEPTEPTQPEEPAAPEEGELDVGEGEDGSDTEGE